MSGPRTEAGKALFTDVEPMDMWESDGVTPEDIRKVEDQAAATERARIAGPLRDWMAIAPTLHDPSDDYETWLRGGPVAALRVLAAIEGESK